MLVPCSGCGTLHQQNVNGAKTIGFKRLCGQPRCEVRVFGHTKPQHPPTQKPKLDIPPQQLEVDFRKKQPWSSVAVPIDYNHFGAK